MVDLFVFYDDVQFTKNDWRNRNKIKTANGLQWLSIPCGQNIDRLIYEVDLNDSRWQKKHWNSIVTNYSPAKHFDEYKEFFKEIYIGKEWKNLSDLNQYIIKKISKEILNMDTEFADSRAFNLSGDRKERLLSLLAKIEATEYLSGPSAGYYITDKDFKDAGINLEWMDYSDYPKYDQLFSPFEHGVSIVDLIFNEGADAVKYMKFIK